MAFNIGVYLTQYNLHTFLYIIISLDQSERSIKHVCTTALLCPFYRILSGTTAISVQLVGSIAGFIINIVLILGIIHQMANLLLVWLVSYLSIVHTCTELNKKNQKINFLLMDALHNSYRISGRVRRWHMRMYHSFWYYTQCIVGQTKRR